MTNLSCKTVTTRKEHQCWGCRCPMPKGSRVLTVVTADGGRVTTARWCSICTCVLDAHQHDIDPWGEGMPDGIIADEYSEWYADAAKLLLGGVLCSKLHTRKLKL